MSLSTSDVRISLSRYVKNAVAGKSSGPRKPGTLHLATSSAEFLRSWLPGSCPEPLRVILRTGQSQQRPTPHLTAAHHNTQHNATPHFPSLPCRDPTPFPLPSWSKFLTTGVAGMHRFSPNLPRHHASELARNSAYLWKLRLAHTKILCYWKQGGGGGRGRKEWGGERRPPPLPIPFGALAPHGRERSTTQCRASSSSVPARPLLHSP